MKICAIKIWIRSKPNAFPLVILISFLSSVLLSHRLWFGDREVPMVPLIEAISFPYSGEIFVIALGLSILSIAAKHRASSAGIVILVGTYVLAALTDQARLQPWAILYSALLLLVAQGYKNAPQLKQVEYESSSRQILVFVYLYSGLHKINPSFSFIVVPEILHPLLAAGYTLSAQAAVLLGRGMAIFEIGIAVLLTLRNTRVAGAILATIMHVAILCVFGPWGRNENQVIWPWNAMMILSVTHLFVFASTEKHQRLHSTRRFECIVVAVSFGILPGLSLFGLWDQYLSFGVYTGNSTTASISFNRSFLKCFDEPSDAFRLHLDKIAAAGDRLQIGILEWALEDLGVPPYPESRYFIAMGSQFCSCAGSRDKFEIRLKRRSTLLRPRRVERFECVSNVLLAKDAR